MTSHCGRSASRRRVRGFAGSRALCSRASPWVSPRPAGLQCVARCALADPVPSRPELKGPESAGAGRGRRLAVTQRPSQPWHSSHDISSATSTFLWRAGCQRPARAQAPPDTRWGGNKARASAPRPPASQPGPASIIQLVISRVRWLGQSVSNDTKLTTAENEERKQTKFSQK